jgi:hypothetical protein
MISWIESQSTVWIAVLVFALCFALAAVIFAIAVVCGSRRIAADFKATTPVMLTPLSVIAGLLIAFLASRVWASVDHAHAVIAHEASAIREATLIVQALPPDARARIGGALGKHLRFVEAEDWPAMAEGRATLRAPPPALTDALSALLAFEPSGDGQRLAQTRAVAAIEDALAARRDRILLSQASVAPIQWTVIVVLGVLIMLTIAMVHIDRPTTVAANLLLFATALAACLVLLMVNDRPFAAGGVTMQPSILHDIGFD